MLHKAEYMRLSILNKMDPTLQRVLEINSGSKLMICPSCRLENFTHIEGCPIEREVVSREKVFGQTIPSTYEKLKRQPTTLL